MNVRFALLLTAAVVAASANAQDAVDNTQNLRNVGDDDAATPERAQNSIPWPTFHRTLSGKVAAFGENNEAAEPTGIFDRVLSSIYTTFHRVLEGDDVATPERAQNSAPWPTFHRTLSGEVASVNHELADSNDAARKLEGDDDAATPERAQNSIPWPTFHRTLSGKVAAFGENNEAAEPTGIFDRVLSSIYTTFHRVLEGDDVATPERAQNSAPWPTFHRTLSGEVASVNHELADSNDAGRRRTLRAD